MQDLAFTQKLNAPSIDLEIRDDDFVADNGLETMVLVSLYTDRYIPTEELPPSVESNRGWWGDTLLETDGDRLGSRLWVFERMGKINSQTENGIREACMEALAWMVQEGIAKNISVSTSLEGVDRVNITLKIERPDKEQDIFELIWAAQRLKGRG